MKKDQLSIGLFCGITASASFSIMALLIQDLKGDYPSHQLSFLRGVFIVLFLLPFVVKEIPKLFSKSAIFTWTRSIFGSVAILLYFYNIQVGGASIAKSLQNLSPMFVMLFSYLFYKERSNVMKVLGVIVMVFGAFSLKISGALPNSFIVYLLGFICALLTCLAYMSLKAAAKDFSSRLIVWQFGLVVCLFSLFFHSSFKGIYHFDLKVLGVGVFGLVGQILLTKSHKILNNTLASSLTLLTLVFIFLGEIFIFDLNITLSLVVSLLLILLGSFLVIKYK